ncbi:hypothetical protein FX987_04552 [Vreelandella titanicae]|uniref:Uncharacterized protein n=1 Tax=Vreelandella titanicae TaxID=664683 RepID=A0AAP9T3J2_9GAMM|nr:hypothetical protein FX987_04552 [Halomonas titanicae]
MLIYFDVPHDLSNALELTYWALGLSQSVLLQSG